MFAEQKFFIGVQDCGNGGLIKNRAFLENMSDTATVHGNLVGETIEALAQKQLAWVITHWKLQVLSRVKYTDTITVRTWSRKYNPAFADRDYSVFDAQGKMIAKATSVWMILNTRRNFPQRIGPELMDVYRSEPDEVSFPGFAFENVTQLKPDFVSTVPFTVPRSMIDYNRHVHNSAYLDIALEALPEELDDTSFNNVEITYKRELKPGQRLSLRYGLIGDKHYVFIFSEDLSVLHTVIKLY